MISPETNHQFYHILSFWDTPNVGNPQPNCDLLFGFTNVYRNFGFLSLQVFAVEDIQDNINGVPGVGMTDIATLNMAIEIVDFPIGGSFHIYVSLLEGNLIKAILNHH